MRRAISNQLKPQEDNLDISEQAAIYRDKGAMLMLDLCHWGGAKDVNITDYVQRQNNHIQSGTYFLQSDANRKPVGYSFWEYSESYITVNLQSLPFGGHLAHLCALKDRLGSRQDVVAEFDDAAPNHKVQKLW